jgi:GTP-binding nuclear protein Ran
VHPLKFQTKEYPIYFNVWDIAGQEKYSGLRAGYLCQANAAIIMFDFGSKKSFDSIEGWIKLVRETCPNIPIVIIGNKTDVINKKVSTTHIRSMAEKYEVGWYSTSVKDNLFLNSSFLSLARKLTNTPSLIFIDNLVPIIDNKSNSLFNCKKSLTN